MVCDVNLGAFPFAFPAPSDEFAPVMTAPRRLEPLDGSSGLLVLPLFDQSRLVEWVSARYP